MDRLEVNIRRSRAADSSAIRRLAVATGLMTEDESQGFASDVATSEGSDALWACAIADNEQVVGAALCARESFSDDVWNLLFLAVEPDVQSRGTGSSLVRWIENRLSGRATALVIDTSGREAFAATRAFYFKLGYREVGTIPDYYGAGDSKVTFWRRLP